MIKWYYWACSGESSLAFSTLSLLALLLFLLFLLPSSSPPLSLLIRLIKRVDHYRPHGVRKRRELARHLHVRDHKPRHELLHGDLYTVFGEHALDVAKLLDALALEKTGVDACSAAPLVGLGFRVGVYREGLVHGDRAQLFALIILKGVTRHAPKYRRRALPNIRDPSHPNLIQDKM